MSGARVPVAPGMPTKSAPTPPGPAHARSTLQDPAATAERAATAATLSRNATKTDSVLARTNRPLRAASMPSAGFVANTSPPAAGRVAIAAQGIETSRASGAPETSGAVMLPTSPPGPAPWGQPMVAVVCRTGSSGASAHSTMPIRPANIATSRADLTLSLDTRVDGRRPRRNYRREQTQSVTRERRVGGVCVCSPSRRRASTGHCGWRYRPPVQPGWRWGRTGSVAAAHPSRATSRP